MRRERLRTPLIDTSETSRTIPSQSYGGIGYNTITSLDADNDLYSATKPTYQSFDAFTENENVHPRNRNNSHLSTSVYSYSATNYKQCIINNLLIIILTFLIGTCFIFLSIICNQKDNDLYFGIYLNHSYMIMGISIGTCFILTSLSKLISVCCCAACSSLQHVSTIFLFAIISCIISLLLGIFGFLQQFELDYHLYVNIGLVSYSALIISSIITLQLLPKNHFKDIDVELPPDPIHEKAPEYIKKYGNLHPYDRSKLKEMWHSSTHQWLWNIIKLGYKQPLEIYDCYSVPHDDHILTQCKVWDEYLKTAGFDNNNFSTFKCVWHLEGRSFVARCVIYMMALLTSLAVPFIISALSEFYEDKSVALQVGIYLSLALWLAAFMRIEIVSIIFTLTGLV